MANPNPSIEQVAARFGLDPSDFAICVNGSATDGVMIAIAYRDQGDFVGVVATMDQHWYFDDLRAPRCLTADSPLQNGYDSAEGLAHMAQSAVTFADYFTAGRHGEETPADWNPHGSYFAEHCYGDHDADGPVFEFIGFAEVAA